MERVLMSPACINHVDGFHSSNLMLVSTFLLGD